MLESFQLMLNSTRRQARCPNENSSLSSCRILEVSQSFEDMNLEEANFPRKLASYFRHSCRRHEPQNDSRLWNQVVDEDVKKSSVIAVPSGWQAMMEYGFG